MVEKAIQVIESFGFQATDSQCAIEAKPPVEWNKGKTFSFNAFITIILIYLFVF